MPAAGCRSGRGRLQDDQFGLDAESHAALALVLVEFQQPVVRFGRRFRIAVAGSGIAGSRRIQRPVRTARGHRRRCRVDWNRVRVGPRSNRRCDAAAAGLADAGKRGGTAGIGQCRRLTGRRPCHGWERGIGPGARVGHCIR